MMIPLMIALGYDRMVTVAVVTVAPFVGALASTINPFMTGIGSSKAGVTIADGMGLRLILLALTMAATVGYTLWYARRVKTDPSKSLCGLGAEDTALAAADASPPEPLTTRHATVIGLRLLHVRAAAPSRSFRGARSWIARLSILTPTRPSIRRSGGNSAGGCRSSPRCSSSWRSALDVGRLGEEAAAKAFIRGVIDFTGPAFLVTLARSVSVVMTNTKTIDTVLHAMEGLVAAPRARHSSC